MGFVLLAAGLTFCHAWSASAITPDKFIAGTGFCASSPIWIDAITCRPKDSPVAASKPRNGQLEGDAGSFWEGPSHCISGYCVFASRQLAGGIAIISTQENANRVAQLHEVGTADRSAYPSYEVKAVPGKGLGLVANSTIRQGERIMQKLPTLLVHRNLMQDIEREDMYRMLDAAVMKLPATRRRAYTRQAGQFGGNKIADILFTNSFQMDLGGQSGQHYGNFPEVSRFNHDCRPNVAFRIDANLTHHTHAVRDIQAGEELALTYVDVVAAHSARQSRIKQAWGFQCTCAHCSAAAEQITASDARLKDIERMERELGNFYSKEASTKMIERLLKAYEDEGLYVRIAGAYTLAAMNYNLFGDAKKAKKYASLAAKAGEVEFGPGAGDVESMRDLEKNPRKHWTWNGRRKR